MKRSSGVLMHISSLPSPHGIGSLGAEAHRFVDFLHKTGTQYWQILPIGPTGYGDSPYQSFSSFAGNPYFIDLDILKHCGFLEAKEITAAHFRSPIDMVDFAGLYKTRFPLLRKAAKRFLKIAEKSDFDDFEAFCTKNAFWLDDYAMFMTLKTLHDGKSWNEWEKPLSDREYSALNEVRCNHVDEWEFWRIVQFFFFKQWDDLKSHAAKNGVKFIGDMPIYVAYDSVDVWANRRIFLLDEDGLPTAVAGCPPDGFSPTGQLWGNPLYDWDEHAKSQFSWWAKKIDYLTGIFDLLRIDHFRGFDSFYAIPFGREDACVGEWRKGPGINFFNTIWRNIGRREIIAEDLGFLTDSVRELLALSGFPGMRVLQFAFDSRDEKTTSLNPYLPHNYVRNCVAYTGTHDNDTLHGWIKSADNADVESACRYLNVSTDKKLPDAMIRAIWGSVADLSVVCMQDLLGLDERARMNTPATCKANWVWRATTKINSENVAKTLRNLNLLYGRFCDDGEGN